MPRHRTFFFSFFLLQPTDIHTNANANIMQNAILSSVDKPTKDECQEKQKEVILSTNNPV